MTEEPHPRIGRLLAQPMGWKASDDRIVALVLCGRSRAIWSFTSTNVWQASGYAQVSA
jgi:hypothetical protein